MVSLAELRVEYRDRRIGSLILAEVTAIVRRVARRYPPDIYGGAATWEQALPDLTQAIVTDLLLREGQLDYLFATAVTIEDFRSLLAYQTRRFLGRERRRTVVDNLLDRAKDLLVEPPLRGVGGGRFASEGVEVELPSPSPDELMRVARHVALIPRERASRGERAPAVYSAENLKELVRSVGRLLATPFSLSDLGTILESLLTDWVAGFLHEPEEAQHVEATELRPEDRVMATAAVHAVLSAFDPEQRLILRRKLEDVSDERLAAELGVSRPTVDKRKKEVWAKLRGAMEDLPEHVQETAIGELAAQLVLE